MWLDNFQIVIVNLTIVIILRLRIVVVTLLTIDSIWVLLPLRLHRWTVRSHHSVINSQRQMCDVDFLHRR